MNTDKDYSIKFRQLGTPKRKGFLFDDEEQLEMYSYDRVSSLFWSAFCNQLIKDGMTEKQAFEFLQSSNTRHMLDWEEDNIRKLARKMAKQFKIKSK